MVGEGREEECGEDFGWFGEGEGGGGRSSNIKSGQRRKGMIISGPVLAYSSSVQVLLRI